MRKTTVASVLVLVSALAVPSAAMASGGHAHQAGQMTKCKNDGHKYIFGTSATAHGKQATFVGTFERFHPCGEDDGYFTDHKKTITLTLKPSTKIRVLTPPVGNTETQTVTAAQFPHFFKKDTGEQNYQWSGPASSVKKVKSHFTS